MSLSIVCSKMMLYRIYEAPDMRAMYNDIQSPLLRLSASTAAAALPLQPRQMQRLLLFQHPQWLRFVRPLTSLLINSFRPFFVLSLLRKPCLRLRTMCEGLYVSRGPQRICVPAKAAEAEILPMMSSVSDEQVGAVAGAPGAVSVDGVEEDSIGRRALSRDMLRALFLLVCVVLSLRGRGVVLLGDGGLEGGWRDGAQAAEGVHCDWSCTRRCNDLLQVLSGLATVGDAAMLRCAADLRWR
jgi:hypothetical protein